MDSTYVVVDKEIWSLDGIFWKKGHLSKQFQLPEWETDVGHTKNNEAISELDINEDHTNSYSPVNDRFDSYQELYLKTEVLDGELFNDIGICCMIILKINNFFVFVTEKKL